MVLLKLTSGLVTFLTIPFAVWKYMWLKIVKWHIIILVEYKCHVALLD